MNRPPLANLFAVAHEDPAVLRELAAQMRNHGDFTEVWQPAEGWVAGIAPLPGSQPDDEIARDLGLAFVEGRDRVEEKPQGDRRSLFGQVAEWAWESPEKLVSLPGDFGFAHFRPGGEATLVRSCGGLVPFYYGYLQGRLVIGTRLSYFVRYLPQDVPIDPLVNVLWSVRYAGFPDHRTFLAGVYILGSGRFARIKQGKRIEIGLYWDPQPSALPELAPDLAREHAERLRSLLIAKLSRDLDPAEGNLLTLSGGIDSSSLAALAVGVVGCKISTWSLVPAPEDLFQKEMSYIQPLARQFQFERTWSERLTHASRLAGLRNAPDVVFQVIHPALCALPQLAREAPIRVLFGGEGADEICGGHRRLPDWLAHNSLLRLLRYLGPQPLEPRALLSWAKRFWAQFTRKPTVPFFDQLPAFVRPEIRAEYRTWFESQQAQAAGDRRPLRNLRLHTEADAWVSQNWEVASSLGIRRSLPFFHREILELGFECHPAELLGPGTKKLLRAALGNDVPARNLQRIDKGAWGGYLSSSPCFDWEAEFTGLMAPALQRSWWPRPPKVVDFHEAIHLTLLLKFQNSYRGWHER